MAPPYVTDHRALYSFVGSLWVPLSAPAGARSGGLAGRQDGRATRLSLNPKNSRVPDVLPSGSEILFCCLTCLLPVTPCLVPNLYAIWG